MPDSPQENIQLEGSYLEKTKGYFEEIEQKYKEVSEMKKEIFQLQDDFKEKLNVPTDCEFPMCFKKLRETVGCDTILELKESEGEPLQIITDERDEEDAIQAVEKFNGMLQMCHNLLEGETPAIQFIKEKMQAIQKSFQTDMTEKALNESEKYIKNISDSCEGIRKLTKDVVWAQDSLRYVLPKRQTGLLMVLKK